MSNKSYFPAKPIAKPDIVFVNEKSECGCKMYFSSGQGEFSDVLDIKLCAKHRHQYKKINSIRTSPVKIIQTPDGKLHPECTACDGTGKEWLWQSRSNESGEWGNPTGNKCDKCEGLGYTDEPITIKKIKERKGK
jgi:hypothetical protein